MSLLIALTISIGLLAIIATLIFLGPLAAFNMQVWQAFVAWASHFHNGGKTEGFRKTVIGMGAGALIGMLSVMLAGALGALGVFAVPVAVGVGAAAMVLIAHLPIFASIPTTVYGFATVAGLMLLGKDMSPEKAIIPTILSIVVGAGFGWLSEYIGGKLAKAN